MASAVFKLLSKAPKGMSRGSGSGIGDVSGRFGRGFSKMGDGASRIGSKVSGMFTDEYGSPKYTLIGITLAVCFISSIVTYIMTKPKEKKKLKHPSFGAFSKFTNIVKGESEKREKSVELYKEPPRRFTFGDIETFKGDNERGNYKGYVDGGNSPWKKQVVEKYNPFPNKFIPLQRPKRHIKEAQNQLGVGPVEFYKVK
jgi:hypothetical protein